MKNLLVIANLHHASPRIPALLVPLMDMGWNVTVVTVPVGEDANRELGFPSDFLERVSIVEAPYRGDIFWLWRRILHARGYVRDSSLTEQLKESAGEGGSLRRKSVDLAMRWYQTFLAIPDTERTWYRAGLAAVENVVQASHFDAILSSSPFPTVHRVARRVKRRHGLPWVADLRDLWSQNHNYPFGAIRHRLDEWLEKRTLADSEVLTTVSRPWAEKLKLLHHKPAVVVRNGFFVVEREPDMPLSGPFTISYTGTIYAGKQDPTKILAALKKLIDNDLIPRDDIVLRFYGRYDAALQTAINDCELGSVVHQCGRLPRSDVPKRQRESHALLLLQWEDEEEAGVFPLKFYEYLAAGRRIIATGGHKKDEIVDILRATNAGATALSVDDVAATVLSWYQEYKSAGKLEYQGRSGEIEKYSFESCARMLAVTLDQLVVAE